MKIKKLSLDEISTVLKYCEILRNNNDLTLSYENAWVGDSSIFIIMT